MGFEPKQVVSGTARAVDAADMMLLQVFHGHNAYWTEDINRRIDGNCASETYRALDRLEQRHMVRKVVRIGQTSWCRTSLGTVVADLMEALSRHDE